MGVKSTSLLTVDGKTAQLNSLSGEIDAAIYPVVEADSSDSDDLMAVVERFQGPLLRYVGGLLSRVDHEAEDIVQETFIRLYRQFNRHGTDSIQHLPTWLFKVAHNQTLDMLRKRKRRRPPSGSQTCEGRAPEETIADEMDALGEMLRRESRQVALQTLSELDDQYRQVLLLKIIQGLSLRQVAEVVGVSLSTVNYRLNRGLSEMANRLRKAGVI